MFSTADVTQLADPTLLALLRTHADTPPDQFALTIGKKRELPGRLLTEQLFCRQKFFRRVPAWRDHDVLLHPVVCEQATSEAVARFHAAWLCPSDAHLSTGIDCCAGLGVDLFAMQQRGQEVTAIEQDPALIALLHHNSTALGHRCPKLVTGDVLAELPRQGDCDWIFIDPDRRQGGKRQLALEHYSPAVDQALALCRDRCRQSWWKLGPGTDFGALDCFSAEADSYSVVSLAGECKELLVRCRHDDQAEPVKRAAILLQADGQIAHHIVADASVPEPELGQVATYLAQPDVAIQRAQLTAQVATEYHLKALSPSLPLLSAEHINQNFPGRIMHISASGVYRRKELRRLLKNQGISHINISSWIAGLSSTRLATDLGVRGGGTHDLYVWPDYHSGKNTHHYALGERVHRIHAAE